MSDGATLIQAWLDQIGAEAERLGPREWSVRVPSTRRGVVAVALRSGERTLGMRAFFLRAPDRAHLEVYRRILRKNLDMHAWRFALDDTGDLWLVTEAETSALGRDGLDGLLGLLSTYVDETFEGVLRLGFELPEGERVASPPTMDHETSVDPSERASS